MLGCAWLWLTDETPVRLWYVGAMRCVRLCLCGSYGVLCVWVHACRVCACVRGPPPAYNFSMVPLPFTEIYSSVATRTVDFMFANPSYFACLERQFGATASVTLLNSRSGFALSEFSGVIFARVRSQLSHVMSSQHQQC